MAAEPPRRLPNSAMPGRATPPPPTATTISAPTPPISDAVVDMAAIREAGLKIGVDPLGGAAVAYWAPIAELYGLDLTVVNPAVDPAFRFMTVDWDGKIRMDCSSPYAMAQPHRPARPVRHRVCERYRFRPARHRHPQRRPAQSQPLPGHGHLVSLYPPSGLARGRRRGQDRGQQRHDRRCIPGGTRVCAPSTLQRSAVSENQPLRPLARHLLFRDAFPTSRCSQIASRQRAGLPGNPRRGGGAGVCRRHESGRAPHRAAHHHHADRTAHRALRVQSQGPGGRRRWRRGGPFSPSPQPRPPAAHRAAPVHPAHGRDPQ